MVISDLKFSDKTLTGFKVKGPDGNVNLIRYGNKRDADH